MNLATGSKTVKLPSLILVLVLSCQARTLVALPFTPTSQAVSALVPPPAMQTSTNYYVDSVSGSDSNPGTSQDQPWRTLAPVHAHQFLPGNVVYLKRGSEWTGGLLIDDSGIDGAPIIFMTYGSGNRPIIRNPGGPDNLTAAIQVNADWTVVEGLLLQDAQAAGVFISQGADHNVVRDIEATNVGTGVAVHGQYNLVTQSYIHDLRMINNTVGGDDDYGAVGIWLYDSNNEVSYNRLVNCKADSLDYGQDGGAIEWWAENLVIENSYVHHNWGADSAGFLEVGGRNGGVWNTVVAYNVAINNGWLGQFSLDGTFGVTVDSFRLENNTIYQASPPDGWPTEALLFTSSPSSSAFSMSDNILYLNGWNVASYSSFTHDHNLYSLGGAQVGFALGQGEVVADPRFVDAASQDLNLQQNSPAIDAGVDLGYMLDFDDHTVPAGTAPDIGAFEYGAPASTPTFTPQPTDTSVPTPLPTDTSAPTPQPTDTSVPTSQPTDTSVPTSQPTSTPTLAPDEIIIDDGDAGFATTSVQDDWQQYVEADGQHYGGEHLYNPQSGTGKDVATWSFTVPRPGQYQVYAWWYAADYRPSDVPYTINYADDSTTVRVDQRVNGGQWNLLGTFGFLHQGSVIVTDNVSTGSDVVADAIRLVYEGPLARGHAKHVFLPSVVH